MTNPTTKREMLERIYGAALAADVTRWRTEGKSWSAVSDRIADTAGVRISAPSLRDWYGQSTSTAA